MHASALRAHDSAWCDAIGHNNFANSALPMSHLFGTCEEIKYMGEAIELQIDQAGNVQELENEDFCPR